jgi:hypothetical protein
VSVGELAGFDGSPAEVCDVPPALAILLTSTLQFR